jgi:hypothetical protein
MGTETVNPLMSFFSGISGGTSKSPVITQGLAGAVVAELKKQTDNKTYNTLADVEEMILNEHKAPIQKNALISEIKVHCRKPINWTPKTGEEMKELLKHRVEGDVLQLHRVEGDDNYVDLCPTNNPGVWMKLKMRQEFDDFKK